MSIVKAKELLLFGTKVRASEAVELGLANGMMPDDELLDHAIGVAQRLADLPPQAVQSTKRAVNLYVRQSSLAALEYALAAEHQSFDTAEHRDIVEISSARKNGAGPGHHWSEAIPDGNVPKA